MGKTYRADAPKKTKVQPKPRRRDWTASELLLGWGPSVEDEEDFEPSFPSDHWSEWDESIKVEEPDRLARSLL